VDARRPRIGAGGLRRSLNWESALPTKCRSAPKFSDFTVYLRGPLTPKATPMTPPTRSFREAATFFAIVAASIEPLLFLSGDLRILTASASFCRVFEIEPDDIVGRRLSEIGSGEWGNPKLGSLLKATASGAAEIAAYEIDLDRAGRKTRHLLVHARKLDDGDVVKIRLLVTVADVTEARAEALLKDELVREKSVLLQEVQHRVANSLQIIASVLMQSARKVQSEEARGHLQDAHHRVMSIAATQRHLAVSSQRDVALRPYFTQLCESLAASMISDSSALSIAVEVDESVVDANKSVSLGLIVTELVINALKHAFPGQRRGRIVVGYRAAGREWALSVTDDGVGMPTGYPKAKAGLGTGIVEALAKHLHGRVEVLAAGPGTKVTIAAASAAAIAAE
jgi:two-component sensor histidine kinase